jgi:hypothetical protein
MKHRRGRWQSLWRAAPVLLVGAIWLGGPPQAAEVRDQTVIRRQQRYELHSETVIAAPVAPIRRLLADYENLPRLNPSLKRVRIVERRGDTVRLESNSEFCVLGLCLPFHWQQDVSQLPQGDIVMAIVPDRGDFKQGQGRWRLLPEREHTRLVVDLQLTPNFWVPPLFGPWLMQRTLAAEALETAQNIERLAATENDGGPP